MGKTVRMSQRPSKSPDAAKKRLRSSAQQSDEVIYQRVQPRDVPAQLGNGSSNAAGQPTSTQVSAQMTPELRNEVIQTVNALIHSPATVTSPDSINESQQLNTESDSSTENLEIFFSKKSFTEEEDNYLRVCLLLFNIGTEAVGIMFDKSGIMQKIFDKDNRKLLHDLTQLKEMTASQCAILDSKDRAKFDISLMTLLLIKSDDTNNSLGKDNKKALEDIKTQRNEIVHKVSTILSNDEVHTIWATITQAIKQLGGDNLEQKCNTLRCATLDSSNTEILQKIQKIKDILDDIKKIEDVDSRAKETANDNFKGNGGQNTQKRDEENYVRLSSLMIKIAPIAVRYFLTKQFSEGPKETLQIYDPALEDVPSMMSRLKNDFGFRILDDELPDSSEKSSDADLTRINYFTHFIVDNYASLDSSVLNGIWNTISEAISRLGDVHMKQQCECLKKANIGEKNNDVVLGFMQIQQNITVLRRNYDESNEPLEEHQNLKIIKDKNKIVDTWCADDDMFVETGASTLLLKRSRNTHIKTITVVGNFGVGKKFTTRHVALILRHEGYRILPVSTLAEIKELDDENTSTLFIVDDFCERNSAEQRKSERKKWRKMSEDILGSKSKIIVCCTSSVYQEILTKSLSYFCSCVIEIVLDKDELRSIAKMLADIDDSLITKYSMEYSCFPFLCKQCSLLSKKGEKVSFVKCEEAITENAKLVYESELKLFYKNDKAKYTALALIVQLNNYLKEGYFKETSIDYRSVLDKINITLKACKFNETCEVSSIEKELKSMIGSYIVMSMDARNNKVYSAKTQEVYRVLVTYFKKELPGYFSGSFPSHKNYSKLHSVRTYVQNRVHRLIPAFRVGVFVILAIRIFYVQLLR